MRLIRSRRWLAPFFPGLVLLATAIWPAFAFQQKSTVNAGNPSTLYDFKAGDQDREQNQRATDLLKALGVSRGDWVADVGAGAGYYSMRLFPDGWPPGRKGFCGRHIRSRD
jgi:hypothetical protein